MAAGQCTAEYTADINLVSGTTSSGVQRERIESLGAPIRGTWSRVADEVSEASIQVDTRGDCGAQLARLRSYLGYIELVINRNGQTVWAGPITSITQDNRGDPATVTGQDVSFWLGDDRSHIGAGGYTGSGDVAAVAAEALTQALTTGPTPSVFRRDSGMILDYLDVAETGIVIDYETEDRFTTPEQILSDLVGLGLTWTVAKYRLMLGPRPQAGTVPTETVADQDFTQDLSTSVSIDDLVTYAWATSSDDGVPPRAAYVDGEQLPRLVAVIDAGEVTAEATMRQAARQALFWPAQPVIASPGGNMLRVPDLSRAVPGRVVWEVQTEFLGQQLRQAMHLESIQVDWEAMGLEEIQPGLTPIGTAVAVDAE